MRLILSANPKVKAALAKQIHKVEANNLERLYLIELEHGPIPSRLAGLDTVLNLVKEESVPIIMVSQKKPSELADDLRWHAAIAYPNVGFLGVKDINNLNAIIPGLTQKAKIRDITAVEAWKRLSSREALFIINQELSFSGDHESRREELFNQARHLFGKELTDKELTDRISHVAAFQEGLLSDLRLPGVFIDLYNLFNISDHHVDGDMIQFIQELANSYPITLWFEGELNVKNVRELRKRGCCFKVLPRELFRGATVEIVYDELSPDQFEKRTKIKAENYRKVI